MCTYAYLMYEMLHICIIIIRIICVHMTVYWCTCVCMYMCIYILTTHVHIEHGSLSLDYKSCHIFIR